MHSPECDAKVRHYFQLHNTFLHDYFGFRIFIDLNQIIVSANTPFCSHEDRPISVFCTVWKKK